MLELRPDFVDRGPDSEAAAAGRGRITKINPGQDTGSGASVGGEMKYISGMKKIAKFEKNIKELNATNLGILITFCDNSQAYLLNDIEMVMREREFAEVIH